VSLLAVRRELVEANAHPRDAAGARCIWLANPNHCAEARHQRTAVGETEIELQQRSDRQGLFGSDEDAARAHVGAIARDELIEARTLELNPKCDRVAFWA
jgi:hypothetical protein